mmetsp:Transcript_28073/g.43676  ORF Transcript_28073/g.43676 Transcript_28073/m.43676 type:complete len:219 (-) Transcript_28073:287-943(-)
MTTLVPTTPPSLHVQTSAMMIAPLAPQQQALRTTWDRSSRADYDGDDVGEDQMLLLSDASLRALALPTLQDDVHAFSEEALVLPFVPKTPAMRRKILPPTTQGIRLRPRALRREDEQFLEDLFLLPALNDDVDDDEDMPDIASITSSSDDDDSSAGSSSVLGLPLTVSSRLSLLSSSSHSNSYVCEESSATMTAPRSSSKTTTAGTLPSRHRYENLQQ